MGIQVLEAEEGDLYRLFEIASLAFKRNEPMWDAVWTEHWTEAGRKSGAERFKGIKNSDVHTTYLKAIDTETGKIVGMAKWNIYKDHVPDFTKPGFEGDHKWESEEQKEYAQFLCQQVFAERRDEIVMNKGTLACLDILAVDPEHQRKGVGHALVAWGTGKADDMGSKAVVESSVFGKGLYEKNGFVYTKQIHVHVPEKWKHLPGQDFAWLVRPEKSTATPHGAA